MRNPWPQNTRSEKENSVPFLLLDQRRIPGSRVLALSALHIAHVLAIVLTGALPAGRRLLVHSVHSGVFGILLYVSLLARHRCLRLIFCIALSSACFLAIAEDPKRYTCPRGTPAIDGKLDDPAWSRAP